MLSKIVRAMEMPANPLDQLTELMGGASMVAEMTGRKGQLIREDEGNVVYQKRRQDVSFLLVSFLPSNLFALYAFYTFIFRSVPQFLNHFSSMQRVAQDQQR